MKISIDIPLAQMGEPRVRSLVAQLFDILGGGAPAEVSERKPRAKKPGRKKKATPVEAVEAAPSFTPNDRDADELLEALPESSKPLMIELRKRGVLTMKEAQELLNNPNSKAVGGIIGSVARWAPKNGFEVPYETGKDENGERYWRWIGTRRVEGLAPSKAEAKAATKKKAAKKTATKKKAAKKTATKKKATKKRPYRRRTPEAVEAAEAAPQAEEAPKTTGKKRGRKKKTAVEAPATTGKKRGRKKKTATEAPTTTGKKRGRKKKTATEAPTTTRGKKKTTVVKKRGRKKKDVAEQAPIEQEAASKKTTSKKVSKKKRGRPRLKKNQ